MPHHDDPNFREVTTVAPGVRPVPHGAPSGCLDGLSVDAYNKLRLKHPRVLYERRSGKGVPGAPPNIEQRVVDATATELRARLEADGWEFKGNR